MEGTDETTELWCHTILILFYFLTMRLDLLKFYHFGKILKSLAKHSEHLFSVWENFEHSMEKLIYVW